MKFSANNALVVWFLTMATLGSSSANAADLFLNLFRNPSIGPELRVKYASLHTGYYPTNISKDSQGDNVTTEFIRTGLTLWPTNYLYFSASHLYGLTRDRKNKHFVIYEGGVQALVWKDRLALRLGVAVIPSDEFGTKVNPTPGISLRFPL